MSLKSRFKSWLESRLKAYSLTSLDTSHDSCPSRGVSHGAGQLDGDLHRDSPLNITTKLVFVLQIQEITVTETKYMCWQVLSNKIFTTGFVCSNISCCEQGVSILLSPSRIYVLAHSWTAAWLSWIRGDVTIVAIDSEWKNVTQTKQWRDMRLTSWLIRRDLTESLWFSFVNTTWLGPGPSLKWDSVRVQAKSWVKSQVKTVSEYGPGGPPDGSNIRVECALSLLTGNKRVCDSCQQWYHTECQQVRSVLWVYDQMGSSKISWHCLSCVKPNLGPSFLTPTTLTSDLEITLISTSSPGAPLAMSSPVPNKHKQRCSIQPTFKLLNLTCISVNNKQGCSQNLVDSMNWVWDVALPVQGWWWVQWTGSL